MWSIAIRVIRSIFEDYMEPTRDTTTRTSFGSDPHRRSTLVCGVIYFNISEENMQKKIKDHPIVVGDYIQWLVSNSGRKEALEEKILAGMVKDRVDEISATLSSTTKRIIDHRTTVAAAKKAADQEEIKVRYLKK